MIPFRPDDRVDLREFYAAWCQERRLEPVYSHAVSYAMEQLGMAAGLLYGHDWHPFLNAFCSFYHSIGRPEVF